MNKHQRVFKEIFKKFSNSECKPLKCEPINLYLTYRGIKRASWYSLKRNKFLEMVKFCKKHKLYYIYTKRDDPYTKRKESLVKNIYDIIVSRKKIPQNLFDIRYSKNNKYEITDEYDKKIGKILGFPKVCINDFIKKNKGIKRKKQYRHVIYINFILNNSNDINKIKINENHVYFFVCGRMCYRQMKIMTKKIYNEFKKNLKNLFYTFSIYYEICQGVGYDY